MPNNFIRILKNDVLAFEKLNASIKTLLGKGINLNVQSKSEPNNQICNEQIEIELIIKRDNINQQAEDKISDIKFL